MKIFSKLKYSAFSMQSAVKFCVVGIQLVFNPGDWEYYQPLRLCGM